MLKFTSKRKFTSTKEFQIIEDRKIGCGSFGVVRLARHRSTCRMYALKIIDLKQVPSQTQLRLIQRQIRLHLQLDHPHIIKLWDAFAQNDKIYMIMEYAEQGNLFYHQNTKNVFTELEAYKFFAQTLQGIKYLHQQNVLHRDLKPENLLIDSQNNIKICDFGWCAEGIAAKRTTFCGTYEYMSPEMLFKMDYDHKIDVWALGILLYQMLHGFAPFKGKSAEEVQQAMLKGHYEFNHQLSPSVKRLINQILQFQPDKRLTIQEILQHPWMTETSDFLNYYLTNQKAILPKDIQAKISFAPPITPITKNKIVGGSKRRKNNSLNFQDTGHNININLQINNFSIMGKQSKSKNTYHSQEKDRQIQQFCSVNGQCIEQFNPSNLKINKMEPTTKNQSSIDMNKVIQKIKSAKSSKQHFKEFVHSKQKGNTNQKEKEKKKNDNHIHETGSKKKMKYRRSQVQMHDKHPIRFNTEANDKDEWCQPPKLKKAAGVKNKLLAASRSMLRLQKY